MKKILVTLSGTLFALFFIFGLVAEAQTAISPIRPGDYYTLGEVYNMISDSGLFKKNVLNKIKNLFALDEEAKPSVSINGGKGTLRLTYDSSNKEALLIGKRNVKVTAADQDVLIYRFSPIFNSSIYNGTTKNTNISWTAISNAERETYRVGSQKYDVWRVMAGHTADFEVIISAPASELYAGTYTTSLSQAVQIYGSQGYMDAINEFKGEVSNAVTIVGEDAVNRPGEPSITVKSPNDGNFIVGENLAVKWEVKNLNSPTDLRAYLYNPDTGNIKTYKLGNAAPKGDGAGDFSFETTSVRPGQYFVNICDENTPDPEVPFKPLCSHGGYFSVSFGNSKLPSLNVISPNGGEVYKKGGSVNVTWKTKNMDPVKFINAVRLKDGNGKIYLLATDAANDGSETYTIPSNVPAGNYVVELEDSYNGFVVKDTSDSSIKIVDALGVAGGTTTAININLKVGDEGESVSALQSILRKIGVYSGPITGFFGELTKQSVVSLQKANAIDAIGEVGPKTRELLNFILSR